MSASQPGPQPSPFGSGANPFAEKVNPYAAPRDEGYVIAEMVGPASPFAGLWRQGNLLVMHKSAPLPDICIKSNQPAQRRLKRQLYWHHPAIYLIVLLHILIYIVVALVVRKSATIHIPLTQEWFDRRRRRMTFSWSAILLCVLLVCTAIYFIDQQPWAPWVIIFSIPAALGFALYGLIGCRLVTPKRITDQYVWLKGVHPGFLDRLEPWLWNV